MVRLTSDVIGSVRGVDYVGNTGVVIRGRLAPAEGALVLPALEAARDAPWPQRGGYDSGSAEPRPRPTNRDAVLTATAFA